MKHLLIAVLMFLTFSQAIRAADKSIALPSDNAFAELKEKPGVEAVRINCVPCHSTDYLVTQPRGDAKQWQAVVTKMMTVYGAVINEQDAKANVDYLVATHGPTP